MANQYNDPGAIIAALDPDNMISGPIGSSYDLHQTFNDLVTYLLSIQDPAARAKAVESAQLQIANSGGMQNMSPQAVGALQQSVSTAVGQAANLPKAQSSVLDQLDPGSAIRSHGNVNLDAVAQFVAALPAGAQQNAIDQFKSHVAEKQSSVPFLGGVTVVSQSDIDSMLGGLQSATPGAVAGAAQPGAAAPSSTLLSFSSGQDVTDQMKADYEAITGQNFDQTYAAFSKQYAIAVDQYSTASGKPIAGTERLWTGGQYQAPDAANGWGFGAPVAQQNAAQKPSAAQFMGMQSQVFLKAGQPIEAAVESYWDATHPGGVAMPQGLRVAIYKAINQMSPEEVSRLTSSTSGGNWVGNFITPGYTGGGKLDPVINEWLATPEGRVADSTNTVMAGTLDASFRRALNRGATAAEQKQLNGADATTIQNYINSQGVPGHPGITYGTWQTASANMDKVWQDNFHRDPSPDEYSKFAGWNADQITRWVDSQKSVDNPTMTIGQRNTYLNQADDLSKQLFNAPADSRTVDALHKAFGTDAAPKVKVP